jgi:hypothetical protein
MFHIYYLPLQIQCQKYHRKQSNFVHRYQKVQMKKASDWSTLLHKRIVKPGTHLQPVWLTSENYVEFTSRTKICMAQHGFTIRTDWLSRFYSFHYKVDCERLAGEFNLYTTRTYLKLLIRCFIVEPNISRYRALSLAIFQGII